MKHPLFSIFESATVIALAVIGARSTVTGQCMQLAPGTGVPGAVTVNGSSVLAMREWDPDGAGPLTARLVVAGSFDCVGGIAAGNIATFDPISATWSSLGSGTNGTVRSLAVMPNGDLVAGGTFTSAGGVAVSNIARWNGTGWAPIGGGISWPGSDAEVWSLGLHGNDLIAGGWFIQAGGAPAKNIARWDGTAWSAFGAGATGLVASMVTMPNGDLVASGAFQAIGSVSALGIARLTPTGWTAFGTGMNGMAYTMRVAANGDLVAAGSFTTVGGVSAARIARWNGTTWTAFGSGLGGNGAFAFGVAELPNGDLVAGGSFATAGGSAAPGVARWNGSAWSSLNASLTALAGTPWVWCVAAWANGDLFAGGFFKTAGSAFASNIARFDGSQWSALAAGTNGPVACFAMKPNGNVVAGGLFTTIDGVPANNIAEWNGSVWSPLGQGVNGVVSAVTVLPNGDLVAGGRFTLAGATAVQNIAKWDGTSWTPLGTGVTGSTASVVRALLVLPNGDLIVGGDFTVAGGALAVNVARWDGTAWTPLGSNLLPTVMALTTLQNGDLIAGGSFTATGPNPLSNIARWNGATWVTVGAGIPDAITALAVLPNGDLVAGGSTISNPSGIARWNGATWSPLGTGVNNLITELAVLPDGDLLAAGYFTTAGGQPASHIARWNGSSWSAVGSGFNGEPSGLMVHPRGELYVGGVFTIADGNASPYLARYVSTCVPSSTTNGNGCASSGGTNLLTATSLPWVSSTFRARGTGLPNLAIVFALTSFVQIPQGTTPLASFFGGLSPAGCDLLVGPDIAQILVTTNGTADSELFLPNTPPLVGLTFFHQMVPVEIDAGLSVLAITATNSLQLTAGDF